ncbi:MULTISPECIES: IclR family transcriptional regulator C-terminal domain-containing protein [Paraburkholderia]|uniref:IclR family transcriptional regulator n=1 Tax=Paraburkholderia dipogonis TaxID=1211383 RepID=A0A4Y8MH42_9BURK|nr:MULTISPECIES: IclR family transcriptional regulator C-terminal domain-containing protein [Paraburkholderia]RKR31245.1 IclR family transcriptional regulator [Paraburkholderia sp. BL17N1]TFE36777.1 IclR family transcriptional regulator [Paraburkholderia dipogonis]
MTSVKEPVNGQESASSLEEDTESSGKTRAKEGMAGLAKGLAIIEAFGASTTRMTVSDAAHLADLSRPAARRCLLTLVDLGYLAHDGKFFTPLPRMLRLGSAYLSTSSLTQIAQPLLVNARDELQESVSLAVMDAGYSVFIARAEAVRIVSTGVKLGGRLPAYCSATGRVLLSGLTEDEARQHLDSVPMKRLTDRTLANTTAVLKAVKLAAENGYAISNEELEIGMSAMAVPVRNRSGEIAAALSVSVFSGRVSVATLEEKFLPVLRMIAARLQRAL